MADIDSSDDEIIVTSSISLLCLLAKQRYRRQRLGWLRRRWWVRPLNLRRLDLGGEYENQFLEMKRDRNDDKFFKYTRMSYQQFDYLLEKIAPILQRRSKRALPPELQFVITLRYFITGANFGYLALQFRVGTSTIHYVIRRTCDALIASLMSSVLPYPKEEDYNEVMKKFWHERQMPNCVGAFDGKHISVQTPLCPGSMYDENHFTSVVFLGICDTNYKFLMVNISQCGSISDGEIFSDCSMVKQILEEKANLPPNNVCLPNSCDSIPAFFVADQAFPLLKRIMCPYIGKSLTKSQQIFNDRLSKARGLIENTFGILTARWKLFRTPICITDTRVLEKFLLSVVCLHNYLQADEISGESVRRYCPNSLVDHENKNHEVIPGKWRRKGQGALQRIPAEPLKNTAKMFYQNRDILKKYFVSH